MGVGSTKHVETWLVTVATAASEIAGRSGSIYSNSS